MGKFAIGLFDLLGGGSFAEAQSFVIFSGRQELPLNIAVKSTFKRVSIALRNVHTFCIQFRAYTLRAFSVLKLSLPMKFTKPCIKEGKTS